jgi:hypothetical protein
MHYKLSFSTCGYAPEIKFFVKLDDLVVGQFDCDNQTHSVIYDMDDVEDDIVQSRSITISMVGKSESHTLVNESNKILSDCYCTVDQIVMDEINVTDQFCQGQAVYVHKKDNAPNIEDVFFGFIGINGDVILEFTTPLYLWMLKKCL